MSVMNVSIKSVATVAAVSAFFGLALVSFASPSMAQQQGEQQMTTVDATTPAPSTNGATTVSLQDLINNQSVTETIGEFTITQQWSPMVLIDPGTTVISHASCGEGQVVIGGGYQASSPGVQMLFDGPSLSANAYAVQAYNGDTSSSFVQVYAICLGEAGLTPGQGQAAQEGSRQ